MVGYAIPFLRSYRGTRPRFASGTLMSLPEGIATPRSDLVHARLPEVARRVFRMRPQGVTRTLSAAKQGESGASG